MFYAYIYIYIMLLQILSVCVCAYECVLDWFIGSINKLKLKISWKCTIYKIYNNNNININESKNFLYKNRCW